MTCGLVTNGLGGAERCQDLMHGTVFLLEHCGITKSLWYEEVVLKVHVYNILNLLTTFTTWW